MNDNTRWLLGWADRMVKKFGQPKSGYDWCRKLAYSVEEEGSDSPSDYAIAVARKWENDKNI